MEYTEAHLEIFREPLEFYREARHAGMGEVNLTRCLADRSGKDPGCLEMLQQEGVIALIINANTNDRYCLTEQGH